MYAIVGLGNPGIEYGATRHNVGFEVIERLAYDHGISMTKRKHKALVGEGIIGREKVILVQPQTYMNGSGESVQEIINWYKIPFEKLIVIYDDISLEVGDLRIRMKGSAGGHNGMKNIIAHVGTQEFPRIRIGIGAKPPGWDLADYVLGRFSKEEIKKIVPAIVLASEAVEKIICDDLQSAMNCYNQRRKGPAIE
ncbi:MAG: aminoacyl-tRNA hydrolase [Epulopiscium sp.]|nr:aminoacyl-tRNA hydrolase [Candidatus Epulonipiscium sp.]